MVAYKNCLYLLFSKKNIMGLLYIVDRQTIVNKMANIQGSWDQIKVQESVEDYLGMG